MPRAESHPTSRRSTKVCTRCRRRKTRCDFKFPSCTPCEVAKTPCTGFDSVTKKAVPRSLVRSLEARVAELEHDMKMYNALSDNLPLSISVKVAEATLSVGVPSNKSFLRAKVFPVLFFQPSCPPLPIAREVDHELDRQAPQRNFNTGAEANAASSGALVDTSTVPFTAVQRMVQNYLDVHRPQYPAVSASLVEQIVGRARNDIDDTKAFTVIGNTEISGLGHFEHFVLFMVLAISAMTLTWKADHQARAASEIFHNSGMKHLQAITDHDEIQGLQICLLMAHYAQLCPERSDNWTCISSATRIVLDLGLHKGCPEAWSSEQRRQAQQLFWVTYGMERSLCTNLRLPLSFPEESITTHLDFAVDSTMWMFTHEDVEKESSANHIYLYRALETEVHRILHLEEDLALFGYVEVADWVANLTARLETWYTKAQSWRQYNMLEFRHVQYNHLRARLHRSTPRLRIRSTEDQQIVLEATAALIDDYISQERRRRLFYPWHGVHILFESVAIALDAIWMMHGETMNGTFEIDAGLRSTIDSMLNSALPQCLDLFVSIGKRWDAACACAKRLRPIVAEVAAVCAGTGSRGIVDDYPTITKHLQDILFSDGPLIWNHHIPNVQTTPGTNGVSSMFSNLDPTSSGAGLNFLDDMELFGWQPDWGLVLDDVSLTSANADPAPSVSMDIGT